MASQSKSIACAAVGVFCLAASAWGQFPEPITGFETDRDGNTLLMQAASFGDLEVCVFQDPREAVVTRANVVADIAATPPALPSTEESFTADFTADSFFGAGGSDQSLDIRFQWATPSNANRWVLVETLQSPIWGDPSLHLGGVVRMKINFPNFTSEFPSLLYTQKVGVALLIRETGNNFPQGIQDTGAGDLEFVGVTSVANANTASPVPVPATFINAPTTSGDGGWVSLEFDLDALESAGRVKGWTYYGGNGVLDATTNGDLVNRGVLAGLVLTVDHSDTTSNYVEFLVDNLEFDAPVGDPAYAPRLGTPIVQGDTIVRVNDVLSSSTNVSLELDRSDGNNEDPFAADQTYNVAPAGALYVDITVSPALAIGDRLRARQTNPAPGGTSAYSIVIPVNPPAAFSLTLSLDEDGNLGVAPPDFEYVGATSVSGTAGTQGKPVFAKCGEWQKVEFSLIPGVEPVIDFAGGNGSLVRVPPTGGLYNIDALFFTIDPTVLSVGPYSVFLDHVYIIDAANNEVVIATSESVNPFPSFRGQSTSTGTSIISGLTSYDGRYSNRLQWTFPDPPAASDTCAPYRPNVAFADTAQALGVWLLVEGEDCTTTGPPRPTLPGPSYGNATKVRVTGLDAANVTSVKIYVDGAPAPYATMNTNGVTEVSVPVSPALSVGKMINATQTTAALGESEISLPRPDVAPPAPTVQTILVPGQTLVTVNNVLTAVNGTASTVTVYVNEISAGTAAGGSASVVVTVAALVNGQVVKATQTVNGVEGPKSAGVTVGVPAPTLPGPLNVGDTVVTVNAVNLLATQVTVWVNSTPYSVPVSGVTTVNVTVPLLTRGDAVKATQTIGGLTGPFSNIIIVVRVMCVVAYADNFDAGTSAAGWNLFSSSADYNANFAYDYSTRGIPPAPNSVGGTTKGLYFDVNKDATPTAEAVSVYPKNKTFSGDYALKFDMWMNYNGGAGGGTGSTEFFTAGLNHAGTQVVWPNNAASEGFWFTTTGEGGAARDYRAYVGATEQTVASGTYVAGSQDHFVTFYQTLFPTPPYETTGVPGKHWVEVEISQINGVTEWRLNGVKVAGHTLATYTSGNVMIGYMDTFTSLAVPPEDNYVVYDNIRVMVARPAAAKGDWDGDADVDLVDYVAFEDCLAGPTVAPDPSLAECGTACLEAFDFDLDGDVDEKDFGGFQDAF